MQTKLLRAIQEGEIRPVGSSLDIQVDVRFVAASHRNLADEVAQGRFREDLYYRINVVQIRVPPLRERREDIPLLAEHMLERFAGEVGGERRRLSAASRDRLLAHDWPGNVRELENVLRSAAVFSAGEEIQPEDVHLPERQAAPAASHETLNLSELERHTIMRALAVAGGNKKKAAELLGIARLTLYRKLKSFQGESKD
jgi:two-component system response regulator HydG